MSENLVIIEGNAGQDADLRHTAGGQAKATFSVAANEKFKSKDGEQREHVEWFRVAAWGNLAEICGKYITKGKEVYVRGSQRTHRYTDKDGQEKSITEVIADKVRFFGPRPTATTTEPAGDYPEPEPGEDIPF